MNLRTLCPGAKVCRTIQNVSDSFRFQNASYPDLANRGRLKWKPAFEMKAGFQVEYSDWKLLLLLASLPLALVLLASLALALVHELRNLPLRLRRKWCAIHHASDVVNEPFLLFRFHCS